MNNIEILEEFIKYFEAEATQRKYRRNITITVGEDDIEAIENLIQENKELKEKQKEYEKQLDLDYVEENYIAKSKLKEKIEELDKKEKEELKGLKGQDRYFVKQIYQAKRETYKNLLEEGE